MPVRDEAHEAAPLVVPARLESIREDVDQCDDDEEESSAASPAFKAVAQPAAPRNIAMAAPAPIPAVAVAPPKHTAVPMPTKAAAAAPRTDAAAAPVMTAIDNVLSDPEELETYLSFVASSTDKKAAQKAGKNVAFLLKVAQFNRAAEQERPRVARAIYDEFLHARPNGAPARDQKGQVEVDVSELRKTKLVSQYQAVFEKPQSELQTGFFDKAARDVEAFVGPTLNKYIEAKKTGVYS